MADLEKLARALKAADAAATRGVPGAAEDARKLAKAYKQAKSQGSGAGVDQNGLMGQFNAGVAGFVDTLNPFDKPHALNPFKEGTGSAADAMNSMGIPTATADPEGIMEHAFRGGGEAAAAVIPVTKMAQMATKAPGIVGAIADDIYRGLTTKLGVGAELVAGGVSGAAGEAVREQGGPEWLANSAEVLAPMAALPAATKATKGAFRGANAVGEMLPVAGMVYRAGKRVGSDVLRGIAPMTEGGAMEVARKRVQDAVGGSERAESISEGITPDNPLNLTPAQQSADPDLLGLERAARAENPAVRDRLAARDAQSRADAASEIDGMTGPADDARAFFTRRRKEFGKSIKERTDRVLQMADETVEGTGPRRAQSTNSEQTVSALKQELEAHKEVEARLWAAVPKEAKINPVETRTSAQRLINETVWAQDEDVPAQVRELLTKTEPQTVAELHGLYSKLRETARAARAGTSQQRNKARIADDVANSILQDLGAIDAQTPTGRAINDARAFSAELHEKFDQGTVGKILNRTIDGDERIAPETALSKTVGRGREDALVATKDIEKAAPQAKENIADSLRGGFLDAILAPDGSFNARSARSWMRTNREVLQRQFPDMKREMDLALKSRTHAARFSAAAKVRSKLDDKTPSGRLADGTPEKAVAQIISSANPITEARKVINTARKDKTGKAMAGLKGAFSDFLIKKAGTKDGLSGEELFAVISDAKTNAALRQVFSGPEFARISRIARELRKLDAPNSNIGDVLNSPANQIVEAVARYVAVKAAGRMSKGDGAGASLQIANMASGRAKRFMQRLTNDRARQILVDAIEDPELMKVLLSKPINLNSPKTERILSRYLTGTVGAVAQDE